MYRTFVLFVTIILATTILSCNRQKESADSDLILRNYCTEIGRFDLLFYDDEISGSYALLPKESLGAVWGHLEGNKMEGRWVDADGTGDIIITFSDDFTSFTTSYRGDDEPEKWYTDSWTGFLRPNQDSTFVANGKTYRCE